MAETKDQDALAEEWAAALENDETPQVDPVGVVAPEATATPAVAPEIAPEVAQSPTTEAAPASAEAQGAKTAADDEALAAEWAAALAGDASEDVQAQNADKKSFSTSAQTAAFVDLTDASKAPDVEGNRKALDFLLDIPLDISAELGRTRLLVNELLQLGQGSVVELNKLAGEPLEVYVNGKIIARGEAVVINEKFGIRLTDIISPIERVKQLG